MLEIQGKSGSSKINHKLTKFLVFRFFAFLVCLNWKREIM